MQTRTDYVESPKMSLPRFRTPIVTEGEPKRRNTRSNEYSDEDDSMIDEAEELDDFASYRFMKSKSQRNIIFDHEKLAHRPMSNYSTRTPHHHTEQLATIESDNDEKIPISVKRRSQNNHFSNDTSTASLSSRNISLPPKNLCEGEPTRNQDFASDDQDLDDEHYYRSNPGRKTFEDHNALNEEIMEKNLKIQRLEGSIKQLQSIITDMSHQQTLLTPEVVRRRESSFMSRPNSQTNSTRTDSGVSVSENRISNPQITEELPFDCGTECLNEIKTEKREWENYACRLTRAMVENERFFLNHNSPNCSISSNFETENERRWATFSVEILRRLLKHSPKDANQLVRSVYSDLIDDINIPEINLIPKLYERKL